MAASVRKVSVAIGRAELDWAERRARVEKTSVSAVLTAAARKARQEQEARAKQRKAWAAFVSAATKGRGLSSSSVEAADAELFPE